MLANRMIIIIVIIVSSILKPNQNLLESEREKKTVFFFLSFLIKLFIGFIDCTYMFSLLFSQVLILLT